MKVPPDKDNKKYTLLLIISYYGRTCFFGIKLLIDLKFLTIHTEM
jgi:hypothetical protein